MKVSGVGGQGKEMFDTDTYINNQRAYYPPGATFSERSFGKSVDSYGLKF